MYRVAFWFLVGLIFLHRVAMAQVSTGTILGVVKDTSAAVMPGVTVTVKNVDTGLTRSVVTDAQGRYQSPNLPLGNYELQTQMAGFKTEVRTGIQLKVGEQAVVDFSLSVGQVAESVEVQGEAPLVETANAAITGVVDDKAIRDLPLNGRSFGNLVLLQVGTNFARRDQTVTTKGGSDRISISGMRPQTNSFLLDGTDINGPSNTVPGGVAGLSLGVDTVREFRVLTSSYGAEYGRAAGGIITAVTRSGTNQLHGSAFEFLRNSDLDARNFFDVGAPPAFKRNQFGATAGGPIRKNKTFFFGSYEGFRQRLGVTGIATVPDQAAHQGLIPEGGRAGAPLVNVGVAPGVQPWLSLYPLPNGPSNGDGTARYIWAGAQPTTEDNFTTRVDHAFSEKLSLFGRYTFDNSSNKVARNFPWDHSVTTARNQYLTIAADSVLSAATLNSFRFGFNRSHPTEANENDVVPPSFSFVPGVPFTFGGWLDTSGFSGIGYYIVPSNWAYNLFEWSDDLTRVHGRHTMKMGLIVKRLRFNIKDATQGAGHYVLGGGLSGFLQGQSSSLTFEWPGLYRYHDYHQTFFGAYVQDDFKLSSRLTLNVGVREEFMTSPTDTLNHCAILKSVLATSTVVGCPSFTTYKNNWMPRVGFAWDSMGNGRFVLRGGYGLFYDQPFPTYWAVGVESIPPYTVDTTIRNAPFPNGISQINLNSPPASQPGVTVRTLNYLGTTYAMQYNFNIQSQVAEGTVVTVGYMGSQGRHIFRTGQMNTRVPIILPGGTKYFAPNAPFINPLWGNVNVQQNDTNSNYNGLVLNAIHQFRGGLRMQGAYTFAKAISEGDTVFGQDFIGGVSSGEELDSLDPYDPRRDRGPSGFNVRHNFVANVTYQLPFKHSGAVGKFVEGWQTNAIVIATSGGAFSVLAQCCSNNGSTSSYLVERPDLVPGRSHSPVLGGPNKYFDPTAFAPSVPGFYGNVGRDTLTGPGLFTFDFSLVKDTAITERTKLEIRAELFNLLNRANFGSPYTLIFNTSEAPIATAGQIVTTSTTSRQIQFGLKIVF